MQEITSMRAQNQQPPSSSVMNIPSDPPLNIPIKDIETLMRGIINMQAQIQQPTIERGDTMQDKLMQTLLSNAPRRIDASTVSSDTQNFVDSMSAMASPHVRVDNSLMNMRDQSTQTTQLRTQQPTSTMQLPMQLRNNQNEMEMVQQVADTMSENNILRSLQRSELEKLIRKLVSDNLRSRDQASGMISDVPLTSRSPRSQPTGLRDTDKGSNLLSVSSPMDNADNAIVSEQESVQPAGPTPVEMTDDDGDDGDENKDGIPDYLDRDRDGKIDKIVSFISFNDGEMRKHLIPQPKPERKDAEDADFLTKMGAYLRKSELDFQRSSQVSL